MTIDLHLTIFEMTEFLKEAILLSPKKFTASFMRDEYHENCEPDEISGENALQDKVVGLFFSALWCPPCQHFVPVLRKLYEELIKRQSAFEIVFVSMDKNKEEMMTYFKEKQGAWLAVKYGDPLKKHLVQKYKISVIPKLVIIRPDGELITTKGRKDVHDKGLLSFRGWHSFMIAAAKKADQHQILKEENEDVEKSE